MMLVKLTTLIALVIISSSIVSSQKEAQSPRDVKKPISEGRKNSFSDRNHEARVRDEDNFLNEVDRGDDNDELKDNGEDDDDSDENEAESTQRQPAETGEDSDSVTSQAERNQSSHRQQPRQGVEPRHEQVVQHESEPTKSTRNRPDSAEEDGETRSVVRVEERVYIHAPQARRRRPVFNSASPSIELIILVVGGVIGCVLLAGFVRWRIKRHRLLKKLKFLDEFSSSPRSSNRVHLMDTIYECNEEGGFHDGPIQSPGNKRADRLGCGHHHQMSYSTGKHHHVPSSKKYVKSGKSRHHHRHHHKRRSARHVPALETIPCQPHLEARATRNEEEANSSEPLLAESVVVTINSEGQTEEQLRPSSLLPPDMIAGHHHAHHKKSLAHSIAHTWRSLSFNRDWVGQMWQERHNIRRISDVVRGSLKDHDEREVEEVSITSNEMNSDDEESACLSPQSETEDTRSPSNFNDKVHHHVPTHPNRKNGSLPVFCIMEDEDPVDNVDVIQERATSLPREHFLYPLDENGNVSPIEETDGKPSLNTGRSVSEPDVVVEAELARVANLNHLRGVYPDTGSTPDYIRRVPDSPIIGGGLSKHRDRNPRYGKRRKAHKHYIRRGSTDSVEEQTLNDINTMSSSPETFKHMNGRSSHDDTNGHVPTATSYSDKNNESPASSPRSTMNSVLFTSSSPRDDQSFLLNQHLNSPSNKGRPRSPLEKANLCQDGVFIEHLSDGGQIIYVPPSTLSS